MAAKRMGVRVGPGSAVLVGVIGALTLALLIIAGSDPPEADRQPSGSDRDRRASAPAVLSVTDFGARGDGTSDDRPAIQHALDAAHLDGASLHVPSGTYLLRSATQPGDRILRTYPDQRIIGDGRAATVVRVASGFGPYATVFGAASDQIDIGSWSLASLTIDQNSIGDNQIDVTTISRYPRMAIRLGSYRDGTRVEVSRCGLRGSSSLNGFYLFARDVVVSSCRFDDIGGARGSSLHDHSTIYSVSTVDTGTQTIVDNTFVGVQGSGGARSAIDTHGGNQILRGNVIIDYLRGFNITGMAKLPTRSVVVEDNELYGIDVGIEVWVRKRSRTDSAIELQQVVVQRNRLWLTSSAWRLPSLRLQERAVVTNSRNDQQVERMVIQDNVFRSLDELPRSGGAVGVDCVNQGPVAGVSSLVVRRNQFQGHWAGLIAQPCFKARASIANNKQ